jgi:hypothetical protein
VAGVRAGAFPRHRRRAVPPRAVPPHRAVRGPPRPFRGRAHRRRRAGAAAPQPLAAARRPSTSLLPCPGSLLGGSGPALGRR